MKRILVVDDNELLCRLACDILRMEGYRAVPATDAAQALEAFEREEFDLLVTDFRMPGMSGLELARAIRDRNPQFPVIVMTAYEPVECEHVTLWLAKEYLFPGLLDKIRLCLAEIEAETLEQYHPSEREGPKEGARDE
jgi:CheY-like chemotaxis protein